MRKGIFKRGPKNSKDQQSGYILLAILIGLALAIIAFTAAAPAMKQQIQREREEELIHRGNEYIKAIRRYYKTFGSYPTSIDQLVKGTNNVRFLRKKYKDPITGKDDWYLIHFGDPMVQSSGINGANGPGNIGGNNTGTGIGNAPGVNGANGGSGFGNTAGITGANGGSGFGNTGGIIGTNGGNGFGNTGGIGANSGSSNTGGANGPNSTNGPNGANGPNGQQPTFGGGAIVGIASTSTKESIKERNGKNHYNDWPFYYDTTRDLTGRQGINVPQPNGIQPNGTQPNTNPPNPTPPRR